MFSTIGNLWVGISEALGITGRHFLSKNVFAENDGVILETVNARAFSLCYCVPYPWKLTSRDDSSSRNEWKTISKLKHVWENDVGYLSNSECYSFQTFDIVFNTPENLLIGISGALAMKESHFLSKSVFWENAVGYLRKSEG